MDSTSLTTTSVADSFSVDLHSSRGIRARLCRCISLRRPAICHVDRSGDISCYYSSSRSSRP